MKEKKVMQATKSAGEYIAPSTKVFEISVQGVICASGGTTGDTESIGGTTNIDDLF